MADILIWPCVTLSVVAIVFAFSAYSQVIKTKKEVKKLNKKIVFMNDTNFK
jgi:hypothetical protein